LSHKNKPHAFLYLAASHPLLEIVTQGILDGDRNRGVWVNSRLSFSRFVGDIVCRSRRHGPDARSSRADRSGRAAVKKKSGSQILAQLLASGQLKAIAPLANREGCVNTIATLIGEIERAAKSPVELVRYWDRIADLDSGSAGLKRGKAGAVLRSEFEVPSRQIDFDQEVTSSTRPTVACWTSTSLPKPMRINCGRSQCLTAM